MSYLYGLSLESFFEPLESDSVGEIVSCPESEKDWDKNNVLTLTVLITTAVLISLDFMWIFCLKMIHIKCQVLFSLKNN